MNTAFIKVAQKDLAAMVSCLKGGHNGIEEGSISTITLAVEGGYKLEDFISEADKKAIVEKRISFDLEVNDFDNDMGGTSHHIRFDGNEYTYLSVPKEARRIDVQMLAEARDSGQLDEVIDSVLARTTPPPLIIE